MTHGANVKWLTGDGTMAVSIAGCETWEEAIKEAYASALRFGYRRPRWWEFRRRTAEIDYPSVWREELSTL